MATMYAWTTIKVGGEEGKVDVIKPGDTVTKAKLGDDWDSLVEARAVRESKYPEMPPGFTGSPRDAVLIKRKEELADIDDLGDALAAAQVEAESDASYLVDEEPSKDDD